MFYFTDIHGNLDLFERAMEIINDEKLIFGGDACDRGDNGYFIMKTLLNRPHTLYLKGNHEDMFVKAAHAIKTLYDDGEIILDNFHEMAYSLFNIDEDIALCLYNGGLQTLTDWIDDGMNMNFIWQIENLPVHFSYDKYDFCHAGCVKEVFARNTWDTHDCQDVIWNRTHFLFPWTSERILVHGHTPVEAMPNRFRSVNRPVLYCGGTKLNMDGGAHYLNQTFLWNIDEDKFWRIARYGTFIDTQEIRPVDLSNKFYYKD